jgi:hypothetical protein
MVIVDAFQCIFFQTMKTASTAIAVELCEQYGGRHHLHKHASWEEFAASDLFDGRRDYFSFAGVRNPLDVAVSRYELRKKGDGSEHAKNREQTDYIRENQATFAEFFHEFVVNRGTEAYDIGCVPSNWSAPSFSRINHIYLYEDVVEEFASILERVGITPKRPLPVRNATAEKSGFLRYYDEPLLKAAIAAYRPYLERWGYSTDPSFYLALKAAE